MSKLDRVSGDPVPVIRHDPKCSLCGGTGWILTYWRHVDVQMPGGPQFKRKRQISEAEFRAWSDNPVAVNHWKQEVCYESVSKCGGEN